MAGTPSKPPSNYRAIRAKTDRNLLIGFFVILFVIGLGLIGLFYGGGGVVGALACILVALGMIGVLVLIIGGLEKLSARLEDK